MEMITCDDDTPIEGKGAEAPSAQLACEAESGSQRSRAPLWIVLGLGVAGYGMFQFRKLRS